ncbi:MAG: fibrobacter succinogenes major paralogous domain-containing protein [Cryomorphaceae bacterium]|nr:fibrobacter succinogenes major paralogous domain-containing protein [Cryomorphaceae bacterium]
MKHFPFIIALTIIIGSCAKEDPLEKLYKPGHGVTDASGNQYQTVIIGEYEWMAEDLKSTRFCDGDQIELASNNWSTTNSAAFRPYNVNDQTVLYYNHFAVTSGKNICPCNWRVPSVDIWNYTINMLGGKNIAAFEMGNGEDIDRFVASDFSARGEEPFGRSGLNFQDNGRIRASGNYNGNNATLYWTPNFDSNDEGIAFLVFTYYNMLEFTSYHRRTGFPIRCVRNVPNN